MEPENAQSIFSDTPPPAGSLSKQQLIEFLTHNTPSLLGTIRMYVQRMGLARGEAVQATAGEVLQEVVVEALGHADHFRPTGQPMAWLLGIAANVIKHKKTAGAKQQIRELSIARLSRSSSELVSESELFDQFAPVPLAGPEQEIEANEQALLLLSLVSPEDQRILQLAFVHDFDREALAKQLGTSPGAARVRLHRALSRLRSAWWKQQMQQQREESNE